MIKRQLGAWLSKMVQQPKIIHIFGLRQTGKTTLMEDFRRQFPGALYYPLYDLVTLRKYEGQPERWVIEVETAISRMKEGEILHVFVDEVQKIPAFFQAIQGLYEQYKGRVKFWIWGSSARPIKRQRAETLAGRSFSKTLWPMSQAELLGQLSSVPHLFEPADLKSSLNIQEPRGYSNFLARCVQHTMLPEPHLTDDISIVQEILESYQATYLENEIRRENLVQDIGVFERFLSLAASEDTFILNHSSKAKVLGISPNTIKTYYGIMEDTFVCRTINAYSKSLRVQISKSPKVYFTDCGLARFVSGERGLPDENSSQFGRFIEGFVINEIIKQIEYNALPWRLSYIRTRSGMEVDLIISMGAQKVAAEIKAAEKLSSEDYRSILALMEMDKEIGHGIVFSRSPAPIQLDKNIYNFPIWNM